MTRASRAGSVGADWNPVSAVAERWRRRTEMWKILRRYLAGAAAAGFAVASLVSWFVGLSWDGPLYGFCGQGSIWINVIDLPSGH
jgi:hypothetical protein